MTWALDVRRDRRVPFDADPVKAGTPGARVLARVDDGAVLAYGPQELAGTLREYDPHLGHDAAMRRVYDEFPWHLPHAQTCADPPPRRNR